MPTTKTRPSQPRAARSTKAGPTYRGIKLQEPVGTSRFSLEQLTEAVKAAIAKNARVLAGDR